MPVLVLSVLGSADISIGQLLQSGWVSPADLSTLPGPARHARRAAEEIYIYIYTHHPAAVHVWPFYICIGRSAAFNPTSNPARLPACPPTRLPACPPETTLSLICEHNSRRVISHDPRGHSPSPSQSDTSPVADPGLLGEMCAHVCLLLPRFVNTALSG